jgi:hypothetical protein
MSMMLRFRTVETYRHSLHTVSGRSAEAIKYGDNINMRESFVPVHADCLCVCALTVTFHFV